MRWWRVLPIALWFGEGNGLMSSSRKLELREMTLDMLRHANGNYHRVAFPADELLPLSCKPQHRDSLNPENLGINDIMGNYALTLVDGIDTFAVIGDKRGFESAVRDAIQHVSFGNVRVQVFEVSIRMLGGLLSAHQLATSHSSGVFLPWYKGELLQLAHDLGRRLLPAFDTKTGIPYARINLSKGVRARESTETCSAGVASLVLEFGTLSRLTGDPVYEQVAKKAFFALWNLRSPLDLVGNTLTIDGQWLHAISSTGAGIDSFFEYAAKAYFLLGEDDYWRVWEDAYASIQRYIRAPDGFWYRGVNMQTGSLATIIVDSLSAFFPGVQVLVGDLDSAIKANSVHSFLWRRYSGFPETFDINSRHAVSLGYPLRPEFIESNWSLYQATKDEHYLEIAERVLHDLNNRTRVDCGFAAIHNLETGLLEDKMPSFLISETLKYLFLTFDERNIFNGPDYIFTTEGHPLSPLPNPSTPQNSSRALFCPAYNPVSANAHHFVLSTSIAKRSDFEHARHLVDYTVEEEAREIREGRWSINGICRIPPTEDYNVELIFGEKEDLRPSPQKLWQDSKGSTHVAVINNLRFTLQRAGEGGGFVVSKIAHYRVPLGSIVVIEDPIVLKAIAALPSLRIELQVVVGKQSLKFPALASDFGPSLSSTAAPAGSFAIDRPPVALAVAADFYGCDTYHDPTPINGKVLLLRRGHCSFVQKSNLGAKAGAKGIIVINSAEEQDIVPSGGGIEDGLEKKELVPLLMIGNSTGVALMKLMDEGRKEATIVPYPRRVEGETEPLLLGGHTVLNIQLKR